MSPIPINAVPAYANGSSAFPFLIDDDDNPFLRGWTDSARGRGILVPRRLQQANPVPVLPMASDDGSINHSGTILFPIR